MLTGEQIEMVIAETCGTYRTGDSYTFEDVWNCIEKALDAHNAGAQGEVAWRYKRPNTYYDEWHYIDAGKSADELRLGIPELAFSPDSDRKDWMPLYAHPQPAADAARDMSDARIDAVWANVDSRGSSTFEPHQWEAEMRRRFARALLAAARSSKTNLKYEEKALFAATADELDDCNETSTDYPTLLDWANRGLLECSNFQVTADGRAEIERGEREGK